MHERQTWRDAYDTQLALARWLRTEAAESWLQAKFNYEVRDQFAQNEDLMRMLFNLYSSEPWRMDAATPFYVSREMCNLIQVASETFTPEPIYPADMLDMFGFMYYETPFDVSDRFGTPTTIAAVTWSPIVADTEDIRGKDIAEIFMREDALHEWLELRRQNGTVDGLGITLWARMKSELWPKHVGPMPKLIPMHMTPWWWGMDFPGNEVDEQGLPTGAAWWWKILQTTFRLMQQHVTVRHNERPPRPRRREAKRMGIKERDVIVVRLRREQQHGNEEPMSEAHYSHRFIVGGHWRNQWYPSEDLHRQIWIAPYEKGPEGSPLILKRRVFNFSR